MQFSGRLADLLTDAGHEVHLLTQEMNPTLANYSGVSRGQRVRRYPRHSNATADFLSMHMLADPFQGPKGVFTDTSWLQYLRLNADLCREMTSDGGLLAELEAEHYDVAISETLFYCFFGVARRVGVKTTMASLAFGMSAWSSHLFGIPSFPAWTNGVFTASVNGPNKGFWERAVAFYSEVLDHFVIRPRYFSTFDHIFSTAFGSEFPSTVDLLRNASLFFVNSNEFALIPHLTSNKVSD